MSQYFLISSSTRNRLLYPNPGKFVVPFGSNNNVNLNVFNVFTTTNPITVAFPTFNCCWTNYDSPNINEFITSIIGGTNVSPILDFNVNKNLLKINPIEADNEFFYLKQPLDASFDILRNFILVVKLDGVVYRREIGAYDPIKLQAALTEPLPVFDLSNGPIPCSITYPFALSEVDNNILINGPFLDSSSFTFIDFELYVYNVTVNEIRKAVDFSVKFGIITIDKIFENYKITDQLQIITKNRPTALGSIKTFPNGSFYQYFPETFHWQSRGTDYRCQDLIVLKKLGEENKPLSYFHTYIVNSVGPLGEILDLDISVLGTQEFTLSSSYKVFRLNVENVSAALLVTSFSLAFHVEFKKDYENQQFQLIGNYFFPLVQSQQYNVEKNKITLQPNNTIAPDGFSPGNSPVIRESYQSSLSYDLLESQSTCGVSGIKRAFTLKSGKQLLFVQNYSNLQKLDILAANLNSVPSFFAGIFNFMILPFSNEGVVPLNFTGTQITQTQMSCYNMSISSLILPNRLLAVGDGLLTSSYPYVFVSITNENNPNGGSFNRFFTNNPFATKALFICSISDVNNPETTKFIKISSDGAFQNVKFSPVDSLGIEISLPNGLTFQTEDTDFIVPQDANPLLQITLFVELQKCG